MDRQADDSETTVESVERGLRVITELNKRWEDRFSFDRPDLFERYLDGRIHFYLKFRARSSAQRNPMDLYTILYSPRILEVERSGNRGRELDPESGVGVVALIHENSVAQNNGVGNDSEKPVFICDIEVVDYLQKRIGRVRSPVRLQRLNEGTKGTGDTLYYSVINGLFEFLGRSANREVDSLGIGQSVFAGEPPNDVVETRPEMVNDFASNDRNPQRDRRSNEFENISATFRLTLANNGVGAAVQDSGNLTIEISDLLFGPLNLNPASVEGV